MKTAKELYEKDTEWGFYISNYQPMLEEFGNILIQVDQADYQGDSWLLYKNDGKYGYLCFGWGSCSGCDALQACSSMSQVQELMDDLYNSIAWFESKEDALNYFTSHDFEADYSWYYDDFKNFLSEVINLLGGRKDN